MDLAKAIEQLEHPRNPYDIDIQAIIALLKDIRERLAVLETTNGDEESPAEQEGTTDDAPKRKRGRAKKDS